jgi:hypothetical protein
MSKAMSGLENRTICARVQLCIFGYFPHFEKKKLGHDVRSDIVYLNELIMCTTLGRESMLVL